MSRSARGAELPAGARPRFEAARLLVLPALLWLTACAHYEPRPLDPAASLADYNARRLDAPELRQVFAAAGQAPAGPALPLGDLALAALYFQPNLQRARAQWRAAQAAEITAGARPQPGAAADVERNLSGGSGESAWGLALTTVFTLELGGKRGARIAVARAAALVAEAELRGEAWRTVATAREAGAALLLGEGEYQAANAERGSLDLLLPLVEARYQEAGASAADVARSRAEIQAAALALTALDANRHAARARLATALGLPLSALTDLVVVEPSAWGCESLEQIAPDSLQRWALGANWTVQHALAEYQRAEAVLRLRIAEQRPDLSLGPGLFFDHGINRWTTGFGLPMIALNRNRGPIKEAEAGRLVAAARVAEVQDQVLHALDGGLSGCASSLAGIGAADSLLAAVSARTRVAEAAYQRGEVSRFEVALLSVEAARAHRAQVSARNERARAGLELEQALGVWVSDPPHWPDPTLTPRPTAVTKETR